MKIPEKRKSDIQEFIMLHIENNYIREHLLDGNFGLEKESLRITGDGHFAHTPHPFPDDPHIVRDFSENHIEINTGVHESAESAVKELTEHIRYVQQTLLAFPEKEYLWPFSNPPYIKSELDIPIAQFKGAEAEKTVYREHLSRQYGRYKMTFSGIHMNFSFTDDLLAANYEISAKTEEELQRIQKRSLPDIGETDVPVRLDPDSRHGGKPCSRQLVHGKGNLRRRHLYRHGICPLQRNGLLEHVHSHLLL